MKKYNATEKELKLKFLIENGLNRYKIRTEKNTMAYRARGILEDCVGDIKSVIIDYGIIPKDLLIRNSDSFMIIADNEKDLLSLANVFSKFYRVINSTDENLHYYSLIVLVKDN